MPAVLNKDPVILRASDVVPRSVDWLWRGRIPRGRITLIAGRPGEGKSMLTADLAARITTGTSWPDGTHCKRGSVLLISAEDDPSDTIRPRLDAHHADVSRVELLQGVHRVTKESREISPFTLADIETLRRALEQKSDVSLVVIDPIGSYLGGGVDSHRDNETREVLGPLAQLAPETGVAVVLVAHVRKGGGTHADDLVLGSRAFTGIARSVLHLMLDTEDKTRRLLLPGKNNLGARAPGLAFTIGGEPGALKWEPDPVTDDADDIVSGVDRERNSALDEAVEWLRDELQAGPIPAKDVLRRAREVGISERTLKRAKSVIGVTSTRDGYSETGEWMWMLPSKVAKGCQGAKLGTLGTLGTLCDSEPSEGGRFRGVGHTSSNGPTTRREQEAR